MHLSTTVALPLLLRKIIGFSYLELITSSLVLLISGALNILLFYRSYFCLCLNSLLDSKFSDDMDSNVSLTLISKMSFSQWELNNSLLH